MEQNRASWPECDANDYLKIDRWCASMQKYFRVSPKRRAGPPWGSQASHYGAGSGALAGEGHSSSSTAQAGASDRQSQIQELCAGAARDVHQAGGNASITLADCPGTMRSYGQSAPAVQSSEIAQPLPRSKNYHIILSFNSKASISSFYSLLDKP